MTLTAKQLDVLCGGAPTLTLHCPFCARTVGPYYAIGEVKGALQTHINYVHFADQVLPDRPANATKVSTRARRFKVK